MERILRILSVLPLLLAPSIARQGFGPTDQEWGNVTVRPGAHMFWWLHRTTANVQNYTERPIVIWLQGGPGASSTGYGNFAELGPLDADLQPRNTTWTQYVNLLLVDNPVGSGFSFVDDRTAYVTTNKQIASDFIVLLQSFYATLPELENVPLYIFCESYGGKMTAQIALSIHEAVEAGKLNINLKGVGLGDSWISPMDSVLTWAPYLLNVGAIDQNGYDEIMLYANKTQAAIDAGNYVKATGLWSSTENAVLDATYNIDFYNILTKVSSFLSSSRLINCIPGDSPKMKSSYEKSKIAPLTASVDDKIDIIMNKQVKAALQLNGTWASQSGGVFNALAGDFMKPVTDVVERLLNETDVKVFVYNGQLDLIVDTPGTVAWVDALKFNGSSKWPSARRKPLVVNGIVEGYVKKVGNLAMYWVNRAGHMVPADNPAAMTRILSDMTDHFSTK